MGSTNHGEKIFWGKKFPKVRKSKTWKSQYIGNYFLCKIYIALGIVSNLEMKKYRMCVGYMPIIHHFYTIFSKEFETGVAEMRVPFPHRY